jgi:hypothetical protein
MKAKRSKHGGAVAVQARDHAATDRPTIPLAKKRADSQRDIRDSGVLAKSLLADSVPASHRSTAPAPPSHRYSARPPASNERIEELIFRFEMGDYLGALSLSDALLCARPERLVPAPMVRKMGLGHRESLLFELVDNTSCLEDVIAASGLSMVEALRALCVLVQKKLLELR